MRVRIILSGEAGCSTIKECSMEQYMFLLSIVETMGDETNESYSPMIFVEILEVEQNGL